MPLYYGYSRRKNNLKKRKFNLLIIIFILIFFLIIYFIFRNQTRFILFSNFTIKKIDKYIEQKNYTKALKIIDRFSNTTFNPLLFYYKGKIYYLEKKFFKANIELKKTLIFKNYYKIPDDVFYYIGNTNYYLGPPYYAYSIEYYKKFLNSINRKNKNSYNKNEIYFKMGKIYIYFEEFKKANYYLTLIFNDYKNNLEYLYYYSISLKNNGEINPAIDYLKRVTKESKNLNLVKQGYFLLGKIYFEKKEYNNSLYYFNKLTEIKPDSYWTYYYIGYIYYLKKEFSKARNALSISLHYKDDNQLALNLLKKISSGEYR